MTIIFSKIIIQWNCMKIVAFQIAYLFFGRLIILVATELDVVVEIIFCSIGEGNLILQIISTTKS